jgi:hypothetical protein
MKMLFLFMSRGSAPPNSTPDDWNPTHPCSKSYIDDFHREGYFVLLQRLVDDGTIDDLKIVFESGVQPGTADWVKGKNVYCMVAPEIRFVEKYIEDDTVIWVRGGFKHWHDWLLKYKGKNWLVLYAANTGRQRWKWWDVVLDDTDEDHSLDKHGRYTYPFIKPIDDDFYAPQDLLPRYDVMIGSSHVHDKKGQWRGVKVIEAYQRMFNDTLTAVVPGAFRRSAKTTEMLRRVNLDRDLFVDFPGHLNKKDLLKIYNRSRIALFLGSHGQNDRGPLEAAACGNRIILGSPKYHSPRLRDPVISIVPKGVDNYEEIARILRGELLLVKRREMAVAKRNLIAERFRRILGFDVSVGLMKSLLQDLNRLPPTVESKREMYKNMEFVFSQINFKVIA